MESLEAEGLITSWRERNVLEIKYRFVWKALLMRGKWEEVVVLVLSLYIWKKRKKKDYKNITSVCFMWPLFIYWFFYLFVFIYFFFFQWICEWKKWKALVEMVLSTVQRVDKQNLIKMTKDRYLAWFFFPRDTKCIK